MHPGIQWLHPRLISSNLDTPGTRWTFPGVDRVVRVLGILIRKFLGNHASVVRGSSSRAPPSFLGRPKHTRVSVESSESWMYTPTIARVMAQCREHCACSTSAPCKHALWMTIYASQSRAIYCGETRSITLLRLLLLRWLLSQRPHTHYLHPRGQVLLRRVDDYCTNGLNRILL